ncbi:Chlorovirus glycoprotein repeat domain-containing protein [Acanthocystis turfacea Chlorella virus MN0810.1]|nr:Chlorovirus glycoprotein repeat domain-containing protein [Acanthocystis turfacea Chlorella virus MN0810.1]
MESSSFKVDLFRYAGVNTDAGVMNFQGEIYAANLIGNVSSTVVAKLPPVSNIDIVGNVVVGNYISVGAVNTTNVLSENFVGNETYANYLFGNADGILFNGYTIIPSGNVANTAARLQFTGEAGSLVKQTDTGVSYLLTVNPAIFPENWIEFAGQNNLLSVFGRQGAVAANLGDYKDNLIYLTQPLGPLTTANTLADGFQYLNTSKANYVSGTASAQYFVGNGSAMGNIDAANVTTGSLFFSNTARVTGQVNVLGNVYTSVVVSNISTSGNVDVINLVANSLYVKGNVSISRNMTVGGNIVASNFFGNLSATSNLAARYFLGNVDAQGNVDAGNVSTRDLRIVGNLVSTGRTVDVAGNIFAETFKGNVALTDVNMTARYFLGNVVSGGSLVSEAATTGSLFVNGNAGVTGQVNIGGNIVAGMFTGNVVLSGNAAAPYFLGNVDAQGNVDAGNIVTRTLFVGGSTAVAGQVDVVGNVVAPYFIGGVVVQGDVAAPYFLGNVDTPPGGNVTAANVVTTQLIANATTAFISQNMTVLTANAQAKFFYANIATPADTQGTWLYANVDSGGNVDADTVSANVLRVYGNVAVAGQVNVSGSLVTNNFIGNVTVTGNIAARNFIGNVVSKGNVDTANVTANVLRVYGNADLNGQVNVTGNVIASNFIGNLIVVGNVSAQNFLGNVDAQGNVDAGGVLTNSLFSAGNTSVTGRMFVNTRIRARTFIGNMEATNIQSKLFVGNVDANGNVDIGNILANSILVGGNVSVAGQVYIAGNIIANSLISRNGIISNIHSNFLGNVEAFGNVDASNVTADSRIFVGGNTTITGQVNILGNLNASNLVGNLVSQGNIYAPYYNGNVDSAGNVNAANVSTKSLLLRGNAFVSGKMTVAGNITADSFVGIIPNLGGNIYARYFKGNLTSVGNVDCGNLTSKNTLSTTGNLRIIGNGDILIPGYGISSRADSIFSIITGNATVNARTVRVGRSAISAGNIDVLGGINALNTLLVKSSANISGTRFTTGNIIPTSNITVAPHIFKSNMPFLWNAAVNVDPRVGGVIVPASFANYSGPSPTTPNVEWGVRLTQRSVFSTNNVVAWDVGYFDFKKDFRAKISIYMGPGDGVITQGSDGIWFTFGGNSPGSTAQQNAPNGSMGFRYLTANSRVGGYINGAQEKGLIDISLSGKWVGNFFTATVDVVTVEAGRRYAVLFTGADYGAASKGMDVSSWNPAGTFFNVGASTPTTGPAGSQDCAVNYVSLEYL